MRSASGASGRRGTERRAVGYPAVDFDAGVGMQMGDTLGCEMISVVIAAHNEAAVIERCLSSLQDTNQALDITVAANGCSDATAELARRRGVRVVEVEEASKAVALNRGDAEASGFPRFYLDADMSVPAGAFEQFRGIFQNNPSILAAGPRREVDVRGRPLLVRAYYAIHSRLPAQQDGLFGRGMIGLSEAGRARFGHFPIMVADDLFLDSLFSPAEKAIVDSVTIVVAAPRRTPDLLRRLVRVRRGNAGMRQAGRDGTVQAQVRDADRLAWWRAVVLPHPQLAPAAAVYVVITALAALGARFQPDNAWARDDSTRPVAEFDPEGQ